MDNLDTLTNQLVLLNTELIGAKDRLLLQEGSASSDAQAAAASASTATTKATEASSSAQAALTSKNAAQTSEANALGSKNAAQTSQTNAANSQTGAATSQTTATTKATEASDSQTQAQQSQSGAQDSAQQANTSKQQAQQSQTSASTSQATATTEANRSRTEADRAKSEADRSAQIAGLNTVSDAVAMAALPLPDVWAPLSDSLRMITGYGREVKVGDDVVARMVNFSRSTTRTYTAKDGTLKIAAINEPCFEKEGLHLDVQSTNLVKWSEDTTKWGKNSSPTLERVAGVYSKITPSEASSGIYLAGVPLVPGKTYTLSFWGYADAAATVRIGLENEPPSAAVVGSLTTTPTRHVKTFVATQSGGSLIAYGGYAGVNTPFYVGGFQVEELSFASSYIPTNGAAATRAADLLQFIGPGNHPDVLPGVPFTFAMRMSCEEGAMRDVLVCPNVGFNLVRRSGSAIRYYRDGSGQLAVNAPGKKMNVIAVKVTAENSCTLRVGASQATRTEVLNIGRKVTTVDISNVAGHVRDFRIWQHAVTDEQLKAIA